MGWRGDSTTEQDYFRHWNEDRHESGESRFEVYNHPGEALPAPSELRLLFFVRTVEQGPATVHDDGIRYKNDWYEPVRKDDEVFDMRANAAARRKLFKTEVPFIKALLGGQLYAYVSFDNDTLEPVKLKTKTSFRNKGHPKSQQQLMNRVARRPSEYITEMERVLLEKFGTELGVRASDKEHVPLPPAGVPANGTGDPQQTTGRQRSKTGRQASTKSSAGKKQGQARKGRGKNPAQQASGTPPPRSNTDRGELPSPVSPPAQPPQSSDNASEHLRRLEQHLFGEDDEETL